MNYVRLQDEYDAIYGIVDMHALTTVHDGSQLRQLTREMVLDLLAVGLDPSAALIRQSDFPEHTELMWIFDSVVPVSWLERTPTYKEKRDEGIDNSMGLLNYPVLQAADIVIYKASRVPVGKDQAAHLEPRARSRAPSTAAMARSSRSRRPFSPMRRWCSGPMAPAR